MVLISGSGTNLQALIDDLAEQPALASIVGVVANKVDAYGLQRAAAAGIATRVLNHRDFSDREGFDHALQHEIDAFEPDLVLLAGFMRILTAQFVCCPSTKVCRLTSAHWMKVTPNMVLLCTSSPRNSMAAH